MAHPPLETVLEAFGRRASRADGLRAASSTAGEVLAFAAGLFRAQGRVVEALAPLHRANRFQGVLEEDGPRLVAPMDGVVAYAAAQGPPGLREEADLRKGDEPDAALSRLLDFWNDEPGAREGYLSRAVLRPYVELLAGLGVRPQRPPRAGHCPFCAGAPWIASRRSEPGGGSAGPAAEGAQRRLGCSLCGGDWAVNRIQCPGCGEQDPLKLPVFRAESYDTVRLEACESCRRYLKSIDLTLDGRAIPEVDDLLSLGLDLWAAEQGFTRLAPGLAGL